MFRLVLICAVVVALLGTGYFLVLKRQAPHYSVHSKVLSEGRNLFSSHCVSCHALLDDGIGPPLGGVTTVVAEEDLIAFIRHPEKVIASGEDRAAALHARYKQMMPSYAWMNDDAIHAILSYIHRQTQEHKIEGSKVPEANDKPPGLSGHLAEAVKESTLALALEEATHLPRLTYSTPDLGIATLRPHPSGDGRLFISDQGGIIYEIDKGVPRIFLDMRSHIADFSIGPGLATGLGSFDFHPDYMKNGLMYITHAENYKGQTADYRVSDSIMAEVQWVLGEWMVREDQMGLPGVSYREILRLHAPTFGHGAQDLAFAPVIPKDHSDYGLLYWGFGDGGSNNIRRPELGHHRRSFLGTVLRIDPRGKNSANGQYGIPADNPFASDDDPSTLKEIYAFGFRNPHRLAWDADHRMIVTDIGESNIEEVNIVANGGDYGWPSREGNFGISTKKDLKSVYRLHPADADLYKGPLACYDHTDGNAISGGYVYDGDIPNLRGKYVFGDIVNGRLFYLNMNKERQDSSIYELAILKDGLNTNMRDMTGIRRLHLRIGYDRFAKQLYIFTKADGKVYRVVDCR